MVCLCRRYGNFPEADHQRLFQTGACKTGGSGQYKLEPEEEIRDVEFYRFISKTLGKELFSSVQITGEGFDQQWAQQSVKLLCHQGRKVFTETIFLQREPA